LLSHAPVTLNITPLEAAGFAMFLAVDPATPKRACPHLKPMKPAFCYERVAPVDPPAITMIRDAMTAHGSPPGVALAVFEDKEAAWAVGYTTAAAPAGRSRSSSAPTRAARK
jgi:CubicO group peptidase (beta-lactamase class C family)